MKLFVEISNEDHRKWCLNSFKFGHWELYVLKGVIPDELLNVIKRAVPAGCVGWDKGLQLEGGRPAPPASVSSDGLMGTAKATAQDV